MTAASISFSLQCRFHRGVLGLFTQAEEKQQPPGIHAATVHQVLCRVEHCRHRGLGVSRPAAVEPIPLDDRNERIAGPARARWNDIEMRRQYQGRPDAPAGHFDADAVSVALYIQAPAFRRLLDEDGDVRFLTTDGRDSDQIAEQLHFTRQSTPAEIPRSPVYSRVQQLQEQRPMGMKQILALFQHHRVGTVENLIGDRDISPDRTSMHYHSLAPTRAPMASSSKSPITLLVA